MELTHTARVPVALDRAWEVSADPRLLADALAGAELEGEEGTTCRGTLTVKVGPINARYAGTVTMTWRDDEAHRMVLEVAAEEVGGVGRVEATLNITLRALGAGTLVHIVTHLTLSGRAGQFGRGLVADVGQRLLTDLVSTLEQTAFARDVATSASVDVFEEQEVPVLADAYDDEPELADGPRERRRKRRRARDMARALAAASSVPAPAIGAEPEPVVPSPEPEPVVPSPEPEPVVPSPEPEPVVPSPEPEPVVPPAPVEPEVLPAPEPPPTTAPPPQATPAPEVLPVDVIGPQQTWAQPSLGQKAAPYLVLLALVWLLRRLFGSSDD